LCYSEFIELEAVGAKMLNLALIDSFREIELEEGFESALYILWNLSNIGELDKETDTVIHEMQRWHLLYGDSYEALCRHLGIDFNQYAVE